MTARKRPEIPKIDFERLRRRYSEDVVALELIDQFEASFAVSKHIVAWLSMVGLNPIGWEPTDFEIRHSAGDVARMTIQLLNTGIR